MTKRISSTNPTNNRDNTIGVDGIRDNERQLMHARDGRLGKYLIRFYAFNSFLGKAEAEVLSYLLQFSMFLQNQAIARKQKKSYDGWFYRTQKRISTRLDLSNRTVRYAITRLKELGILQVELKGYPAKTYYRIMMDPLEALIEDNAKTQ